MCGYLRLKQFWNIFGLNIFKKDTKFVLLIKSSFYFILFGVTSFTHSNAYYSDIQDNALSYIELFLTFCFVISAIYYVNYKYETIQDILNEIILIEKNSNRFTKSNKAEIVSLIILLAKLISFTLNIIFGLYTYPLNYVLYVTYFFTGNLYATVDNILFYIIYKILTILQSNNNDLKNILASKNISENNRLIILEQYMTQLNTLKLLCQKINRIFNSLIFFKILLDFIDITYSIFGAAIWEGTYDIVTVIDSVFWITNSVIDIIIFPLLFHRTICEVSIDKQNKIV